jgi:hypothetical protein
VDDSPNAVPEVTAEINMSLAAVGEHEMDPEAGVPDQESDDE